MEAYHRAFVNNKQNEWANLLPMAEFVYNNAKSAHADYTRFEQNCDFHPRVSNKEDVNPYYKSKAAN